MKTCTICHLEKSLTEFYRNRKWYDSKCKKCAINNANQWKKDNPKKRAEQLKKWRESNKWTYIAQAHTILSSMKQRSKKKNLQEPEWTIEEIKEIIKEWHCNITNIKFTFNGTKTEKNPFGPSPDRIDNNIGYTKENTQWVCTIYNLMKNTFLEEDVKKFISSLRK